MHYFHSFIHFLRNSFDTPVARLRISRIPEVKILLLIVPVFLFLLPRLGALALLSILAWFPPSGIFVRLLSFPSLKFQHFLNILAQTHSPVLFIFYSCCFPCDSFLPPLPLLPPPHCTSLSPGRKPNPQRRAGTYRASGDLKEAGFGCCRCPGTTAISFYCQISHSSLRSARDLKAHPGLRL